jgi:hypothetical protein
MELIIFVATLIIGGVASLLLKANPKIDYKASRLYIYFAIAISACYWIFYFSGLKNAVLLTGFKFAIGWGKYILSFVLGFLVAQVIRLTMQPAAGAGIDYTAQLSANTLTGLAILTGNIFLIATVGKMENLHDMTSFFVSSGYSVSFLYFIMTAESLGAIGILLNFKWRTGVPAAAGLICIMIGAVYTHWHNRDPFSDSYAAVIQLINLCLLQVLYFLKRLFNIKQAAQAFKDE